MEQLQVRKPMQAVRKRDQIVPNLVQKVHKMAQIVPNSVQTVHKRDQIVPDSVQIVCKWDQIVHKIDRQCKITLLLEPELTPL